MKYDLLDKECPEECRPRRAFPVEVHLLETSQVITHDAVNAYTKGPFYCVYTINDEVFKYPVAHIWRVKEGYRK